MLDACFFVEELLQFRVERLRLRDVRSEGNNERRHAVLFEVIFEGFDPILGVRVLGFEVKRFIDLDVVCFSGLGQGIDKAVKAFSISF